mmetsp:Transcript_21466/g.54867  ORF Transcript_21466/g.54867 Transcript_21466/m.54867 type:complete len:424 (+) Transcript_21466:178-1449(+)
MLQGVRHGHHPVPANRNAAGGAEADPLHLRGLVPLVRGRLLALGGLLLVPSPLVLDPAVGIQHLHSAVVPVAHEDGILIINRQSAGKAEHAVLPALFSEKPNERAGLLEDVNPAALVRHNDIASPGIENRDTQRPVKLAFLESPLAKLPQIHALGIKHLHTAVPTIRDKNFASIRHRHPLRKRQLPVFAALRTETSQQFSRRRVPDLHPVIQGVRDHQPTVLVRRRVPRRIEPPFNHALRTNDTRFLQAQAIAVRHALKAPHLVGLALRYEEQRAQSVEAQAARRLQLPQNRLRPIHPQRSVLCPLPHVQRQRGPHDRLAPDRDRNGVVPGHPGVQPHPVPAVLRVLNHHFSKSLRLTHHRFHCVTTLGSNLTPPVAGHHPEKGGPIFLQRGQCWALRPGIGRIRRNLIDPPEVRHVLQEIML